MGRGARTGAACARKRQSRRRALAVFGGRPPRGAGAASCKVSRASRGAMFLRAQAEPTKRDSDSTYNKRQRGRGGAAACATRGRAMKSGQAAPRGLPPALRSAARPAWNRPPASPLWVASLPVACCVRIIIKARPACRRISRSWVFLGSQVAPAPAAARGVKSGPVEYIVGGRASSRQMCCVKGRRSPYAAMHFRGRQCPMRVHRRRGRIAAPRHAAGVAA